MCAFDFFVVFFIDWMILVVLLVFFLHFGFYFSFFAKKKLSPKMCYLFAICFVCLPLFFHSLFLSLPNYRYPYRLFVSICGILCAIAHRAYAEHRLCNTKLWEQQCDQSQIKTRIFRKFKRKISGTKTVREGICCAEYYQQQSTGKTIDFIITGATTLSVHKSITRISCDTFISFLLFLFWLFFFVAVIIALFFDSFSLSLS